MNRLPLNTNIIIPKYNLGDIVYLTTDELNSPRMITGISVRGNLHNILYSLSHISQETYHYEFEFSKDKKYN